MLLKGRILGLTVSTVLVLACSGMGQMAYADTPSDAVVTFQFKTKVDASQLGGDTATPLRVTYQFAPPLLPGTGPFGSSGDGTYESYGPFKEFILELGQECVAVRGDGTGITVFNNSGGGTEDAYDVRGDVPATTGTTLMGLNFRFMRFLLLDSDGTMFDSVSLPVQQFSTAAAFQQTTIELRNLGGQRFRLNAGDAPYVLDQADLPSYISALSDEVNGATQLTPALKAKLLEPLQRANTLLDGVLDQKDVTKARGALEDFIKLVQTNRNKIGQTSVGFWTPSAEEIAARIPRCA
ncbi:hypothetical protein ACIPY0_00455 [Paenarthrobacter nicotinovorans]|uniref:hypothetical protein n=1 Tax=Paenarthrobacter nicotinovorans TaxID=29320 RepID=UPI0037F1CBE6